MAQSSLTSYQHVWRDYSQPPFQSIILKLNTYQTLLLLALFECVHCLCADKVVDHHSISPRALDCIQVARSCKDVCC